MPPSASSTLVNVAEDAELRLVRALAETSASPSASSTPVRPNFVQDCEACIVHRDPARLMSTIVQEPGAIAALVYGLQDEAVSAVSLLAALLDRVNEASSTQLVEDLADSFVRVADTTSTSDLDEADRMTTKQITLLSTLYNMRSNGKEKYALLLRMMQLVAAASRRRGMTTQQSLSSTTPASQRWLEPNQPLGKFLDGNNPPLLDILDEWGIPPAERRELYRSAAEGATNPVTRQRLILLLVGTYSGSDVDAQGLQSAREAAVGAIRDPVTLFLKQRNILSLPAVQALRNAPDTAALFELLKIFQEGKLEDYHAFLQSNNGGDAILQKWGLDGTACISYMRILSLCSLASEHEEIPYSVVAATLQASTTASPDELSKDVERWVIAAVSSGLLYAKMDQLQQMVIVERCVVRKFGMEQWKVLQSRLQLWKKNVGGILDTYRKSHASLNATMGAAGGAPPSSS